MRSYFVFALEKLLQRFAKQITFLSWFHLKRSSVQIAPTRRCDAARHVGNAVFAHVARSGQMHLAAVRLLT